MVSLKAIRGMTDRKGKEFIKTSGAFYEDFFPIFDCIVEFLH
jgi:hypothetical protein